MRKLLPLFLGAFLVLFLVLAPAWPVLAQDGAPIMVGAGQGKTESLGLVELNNQVQISGYYAETSVTMTFANPGARPTEGDLYFPLPEGATVSGYALDIQGQMVDGVAVEKAMASNVFDSIKSHMLDPGLVEWTTRDHFRTRVFPIPAHGQRVVRVRYVSELTSGRDGLSYCLPMGYTHPIPKFTLRVEVIKPAAEPQIRQSALANFHFAHWHDSVVAETVLENAMLGKALIVALPDVEKQTVQVEKNVDGSTYFAIHDFPPSPLPEVPAFSPKHVAIYWDASGSRAAVDHNRELESLKLLLSEWSAASKVVAIDLVLLRNVQSPPQHFKVTSGNVAELLKVLANVDYDGATQLGALTPLPGKTPDCALLFSDGVSTFGNSDPAPFAVPLFAFSADPNSDWAVLEHLVGSSGGRCFDLAKCANAEILAAIARPPASLLTTTAGGKASGLLSSPVDGSTDHCTVMGRLDSEQAAITLHYRAVGQEDIERTFTVDAKLSREGSVLRSHWAQQRLRELVNHEIQNKDKITALGKEFGLVTPFTSLMVLETEQQYIQYGIEPPPTRPEMQKAYRQYFARTTSSDSSNPTALSRPRSSIEMAFVVTQWADRVRWWATDTRPLKESANRMPTRPAPPSFPRSPVAPSGMGGGFGFGSPFGNQSQNAGGNSGSMGGNLGGGGMSGGMGSGGGMGGGMGGGGMGGGGMGGGGMGGGFAGNLGGNAAALGVSRPAAGAPQFNDAANNGAVNDELFSTKAFRHHKPAQIALQPGNPLAPYIAEMQAAPAGQAYAVYRKHRVNYLRSPDFFIDCADFFFARQEAPLAVQILSNLAELESSDPTLLRLMAYRLAQAEFFDLAVDTFEEVLTLRPKDPRSYRDLALALSQRADAARSARKGMHPAGHEGSAINGQTKFAIREDYSRAVDNFTEIVTRHWDGSPAEIDLLAIMERSRIIARSRAFGLKPKVFDHRLSKLLDLDLRIVAFPIDDVRLNLVVTEPSGEKASLNNCRTKIGGLVSRAAEGTGPVEYLVRRALNGEYVIEANCVDRAGASAAAMVRVDIFTNFGRENEKCRSLMVRLKETADLTALGKVTF